MLRCPQWLVEGLFNNSWPRSKNNPLEETILPGPNRAMELQSHHLRLLDGAVVANAIVEPSMVLVNSTHIGLL